MGGQSESIHSNQSGLQRFEGTINTEGGGFCSIRAKLPNGLHLDEGVTGFGVTFTGDGKAYKFTLSNGNTSTGGPFSQSPVWQIDLSTHIGTEQTEILSLSNMKPSFGGRASSRPSDADMSKKMCSRTSSRSVQWAMRKHSFRRAIFTWYERNALYRGANGLAKADCANFA